jgi:hypothetical protein
MPNRTEMSRTMPLSTRSLTKGEKLLSFLRCHESWRERGKWGGISPAPEFYCERQPRLAAATACTMTGERTTAFAVAGFPAAAIRSTVRAVTSRCHRSGSGTNLRLGLAAIAGTGLFTGAVVLALTTVTLLGCGRRLRLAALTDTNLGAVAILRAGVTRTARGRLRKKRRQNHR